ncbi:MAG TPA: FecR domain-containing protein [bacterium]|nr:FecR domain-containing protein [bacterium]HQP99283.1 FecR domain-containing protein [bacterium]
MKREPDDFMTTAETALIRKALDHARIPMDRVHSRQAFLKKAVAMPVAEKNYWLAWVFSRRIAIAGAFGYATAILIYLAIAVSNGPIAETEGVQNWKARLRASFGGTIHADTGSRLTLKDGTIVDCRDNSTLRVSFSESQRQVELYDGTLRIAASPDTTRPFVVAVGDAEVVALGTRFLVSTKPLPDKQGAQP